MLIGLFIMIVIADAAFRNQSNGEVAKVVVAGCYRPGWEVLQLFAGERTNREIATGARRHQERYPGICSDGAMAAFIEGGAFNTPGLDWAETINPWL